MDLGKMPILNWYCNPEYFVMYQGKKRRGLNFGQTGAVFLARNRTFFMPHTDPNTFENKVFEVNREDVAGEDECFEVVKEEEDEIEKTFEKFFEE
jgi:hypothetical protein